MKKSKGKRGKSKETSDFLESIDRDVLSDKEDEAIEVELSDQPQTKPEDSIEIEGIPASNEISPTEKAIDVEVPAKETESKEKEEKSKEQEYYDKLIRLAADFDNYKKRVLKEKSEFLKYANERIIKEIIPVIDNLERAAESFRAATELNGIIQGIELILNQFKSVLKKEGVEAVESKGEEFNPLIHEAISQIPTNEHPPNTIIEEQSKAYFLNNKLIRPAAVVVSKATLDNESEEKANSSRTDSSEEEADQTLKEDQKVE